MLLRAGAAAVAATVLAPAGRAAAAPAADAPAPAGTRDGLRDELRGALEDLRAMGVTGAQGQISIGRRDVVARAGVADLGTRAPMPAAGRFRIGSNTKTFVSVVVLQLAGEGRLSLDDTVERWLPGVVAGNGNDGARITVRQLLQHTSGLYNYVDDLAAIGSAEQYVRHRYDHYDPADLVAMAMRHAPNFAPGEHWDYSNTNYVLAGMIVRRVTGRSWAEQVRDRITRPLGLRDTYFPYDHPSLPASSARAYQQFAPGGPLVDVTEFNLTAADAAGGLVSTTDDLARFWRALQRGELLRPAQAAELHRTVLAETFQEIRAGMRYGLGIFWVPTRRGGFWAHPGGVPGTSTFNGVSDSGDRAVVVYRTTGLADPAAGGALDARALALVEHVMSG
ncbi:serine hydrolase domain-containing protein [Dactylosporangium sp. NPDC048998]|uniref:serine hydrolase domain-containing protein n=1 Tax=Dactylosporangium sp. NPDC048998 TaxID=3363976 RepID=UPI0037240767